MVDYVLEICKDMKLETVYAIMLADNYRAINLMKKMGFTIKSLNDGTVKGTLNIKEEETQCIEPRKAEEMQIQTQAQTQLLQEEQKHDELLRT
jgi:hypothetical protein